MNHQQTIGVLALQGAFIEHEQKLTSLGLHCREIRQRADLDDDLSGLVLPGGESSVQKKLLRDLSLFLPLQERIRQGMPVLATCAGLILLAEEVEGKHSPASRHCLSQCAAMPMAVSLAVSRQQAGSQILVPSRCASSGLRPSNPYSRG